MRKLTSLFLCLFLALGMTAQEKSKETKETKENKGVIFDHGTLAESLAKAKKNKKGPNIVFLDCFTTWCGPCKQMTNVVFPMEHVGKFFNANFVNIKIDMEKGEGIELAKKYAIKAYPTFLILDADGNEINRIVGGGEADAFIEKVKQAMDPKTNPKYKKEAYLAKNSVDNAVAYLEALEDSYLNKEMTAFLEEVFATLSPRERYSDKMWAFVSQVIGDPNSKLFEIVMSEKSIADNFVSKERVDKAICNGVKNYAYTFISGRIQNPDNAKVLSIVNYLNLLGGKDDVASYVVKISKLYSENKIDAIAEMLKPQSILAMNSSDRDITERFLLSVKGLPKEKVAEYYKAKAELLKKQADQYAATAEKFSK